MTPLRYATIAVLALLPVGTTGSVSAQDGAITASLTVLLPPATGTGVKSLEFGNLAPGSATEVLPTVAAAGHFRLDNVPRNRSVQLTFTMPATLDRAGGGSGLPVYFDGPYVRTCGPDCQTHTLAPVYSGTQWSAEVIHVRSPPYGSNSTILEVDVGGRAEPTAQQEVGTYQGTIELTFAVL